MKSCKTPTGISYQTCTDDEHSALDSHYQRIAAHRLEKIYFRDYQGRNCFRYLRKELRNEHETISEPVTCSDEYERGF
jgi:hypothetical protein